LVNKVDNIAGEHLAACHYAEARIDVGASTTGTDALLANPIEE
jgi:hypothetical protein